VVKLLRFEVDFEREGTEQSYLHMCVLVMCRLVDMELHVLAVKLQLFRVVQKVFKFLVSQSIVLKTLLHIKLSSKHRHKDLLVDQNRVKHKLVSLFDGLVVVLHVEECDHLLIVPLVRGQPESKLVAAGLLCNRIVGSVARDRQALGKNILLF